MPELLALARQRTRKGDQHVYAFFARSVNSRVAKLLLSSKDPDHDDIVQNVFLSVFQNIDKVKNPDKFAGWVARITHNTVCEALRKRKGFQSRSLRDAELPEMSFDPSHTYEQRELLKCLRNAIDELPPVEHFVFVYRKVLRLSWSEITDLCSCSLSSAQRALNEALRLLARREPLLRPLILTLNEDGEK